MNVSGAGIAGGAAPADVLPSAIFTTSGSCSALHSRVYDRSADSFIAVIHGERPLRPETTPVMTRIEGVAAGIRRFADGVAPRVIAGEVGNIPGKFAAQLRQGNS